MGRVIRGIVAIGVMAGIVWALSDRQAFGEWLRRMTDGPTNLVLIGTSGFEREGRDPAKAR